MPKRKAPPRIEVTEPVLNLAAKEGTSHLYVLPSRRHYIRCGDGATYSGPCLVLREVFKGGPRQWSRLDLDGAFPWAWINAVCRVGQWALDTRESDVPKSLMAYWRERSE